MSGATAGYRHLMTCLEQGLLPLLNLQTRKVFGLGQKKGLYISSRGSPGQWIEVWRVGHWEWDFWMMSQRDSGMTLITWPRQHTHTYLPGRMGLFKCHQHVFVYLRADVMMMSCLLVLNSVTSSHQWMSQPMSNVYLKEGTFALE